MKASRISVPTSHLDKGLQQRCSAAAKLSSEGRRGGKRKRGPRIIGDVMILVVAFVAAALMASSIVAAAPSSSLSSLGTCGAITNGILEQGPANCVIQKNAQWVRRLPSTNSSSSATGRRRLQAPSPPHNRPADDPTHVVHVVLGVGSVQECCGLCESDAALSADFGCNFSYCAAAAAAPAGSSSSSATGQRGCADAWGGPDFAAGECRYEYVSYTQRQNRAAAWRADVERDIVGGPETNSSSDGASRLRGPPLFPTTLTSGKPVPPQLGGLLADPEPKNFRTLGPYLVYLPAEFAAARGRGASFYQDSAPMPPPSSSTTFNSSSPLCNFFGPANFLRSVSNPNCVYNLTDASRLADVAAACDAVAGCEGFTLFTVSGLTRMFMWYNEALFGGPAKAAAVEPADVDQVSDEARVALLLRGGISNGGCLVLAGALTAVRDNVSVAPAPDGGRLRFVTPAELAERAKRSAGAAAGATRARVVGASVAAAVVAALALLIAALLLLAAARRRRNKEEKALFGGGVGSGSGRSKGTGSLRSKGSSNGGLVPDDGGDNVDEDDELGPEPGNVSVLPGRLSHRFRELAADVKEEGDGADVRAAEEFRRLRERLREWELPLSSIELLERPGTTSAATGGGGATPPATGNGGGGATPPATGNGGGGATPPATGNGGGSEWLLGRGRSGEVYCALLDGLQLVAAKIFVDCQRDGTGGGGGGQRRDIAAQLAAAREIDLLCSLRCPHILGFVGVVFGEQGGEGEASAQGGRGDVEVGGGGGAGVGVRGGTATCGGSRVVLVTEHLPRGDLAAALLRDGSGGGAKGGPRRFTWTPRYTPPLDAPKSSSSDAVPSPSPPAVRRLRVQGTGQNWSVAAGVCRALAHLHKKGIAHLDVKPANVLLTQSWQPVLCDFGLAKRVRKLSQTSENRRRESKQGDDGGEDGGGGDGGGDGFDSNSEDSDDEEFGGTFAFTAPEIFLRTARRTTAADIYSLGVLLWSMCAEPDGDEKAGLVFSRGAPPPERPLRELSCPREAPAEVADVIKRCLAVDPRERPTAEWLALFFAEGLEALDVAAGVRGVGRAQGEKAAARSKEEGEGGDGDDDNGARDSSSDRRRRKSDANTTPVDEAVRRVVEEAAGEQ